MTKYYRILKLVISKDDLATIELLLDHIENMLFQVISKPDYQQLIERSDNSVLAEELINEISVNSNKKEMVTELRKELSSVRYLRLTFSQRPTKLMISLIGNWVKENMGENVVIDWSINIEIIAGAEISYEGKYGDYSTKKAIEAWWKSQGSVIKEMLEI